MTETVKHSILPVPGFHSRDAALFVAQMEDQTRRLKLDTRRLTAEQIGWQSSPGMNTIGMLLAHIAIVEVFWTRLALEGRPMPFEIDDVLGIRTDDDGMPLEPEGAPPPGLAGRELGYFDDLLDRARAHTLRIAGALADQELEREVVREQPDPVARAPRVRRIVTPRWALYHVLEHEAGHYGQILLLRHLITASSPSDAARAS